MEELDMQNITKNNYCTAANIPSRDIGISGNALCLYTRYHGKLPIGNVNLPYARFQDRSILSFFSVYFFIGALGLGSVFLVYGYQGVDLNPMILLGGVFMYMSLASLIFYTKLNNLAKIEKAIVSRVLVSHTKNIIADQQNKNFLQGPYVDHSSENNSLLSEQNRNDPRIESYLSNDALTKANRPHSRPISARSNPNIDRHQIRSQTPS
jgi:hypothetical protein